MSAVPDLAPRTEEEVATALRNAAAPLAIEGSGTLLGMLRPVQAARTLSTRNLTGITLLRPQEMVVSARAGTTLAEIDAALAEGNQVLVPEPPDLRGLMGVPDAPPPTIGGLVAANLSGPRRITGFALRDAVLGIRFVNGAGEVLRSGGRVHKNVTGLDLCKLLAGSHGTLGVITEVTLKVGPAAERTATLVLPVADEAAGVAALSAALTSPYGVTGAAMLPAGASANGVDGGVAGPAALLRLEDVEASVTYRMARLQQLLPAGRVIEAEASRALWRAIRDVAPLAPGQEEAVWRVSVRPSRAAGMVAALRDGIGARVMLDWGGGLVWVAGPASAEAHAAVMAAAGAVGGTFTLFRAPDPLRAAVAVIPPEPPALAALSARVKAALDPAGRLNPGRMRAGG
ncbi:glycolate oxidase FAD binding subunit [Roseomonas rosea]|uniref:Glycolate oxidase FAD binding subunit n=1 Tax=Muricoccus roseus TaxID=198092 RepID=A0A1M6JXR2_9PROT|nr:FAD-binding protein [Roseomonas rosea]SHJ51485.1 glycolate oxidase FAD binding subunit [Roseomonas rosea]